MNVARRWGARAAARSCLVGLVTGLLAAYAVTPAGATTPQGANGSGPTLAAAVPASPGSFAGAGFDACTAPASDLMAGWRLSSPYRAVGIYVGGVNRGCTQPQLTPAWVGTPAAAGVGAGPLYVGVAV